MQYLFSVIIPVFNSQKYLHSTLNSVLSQKKNNTEIILVNDRSTDKSKKICDFFKNKYKSIRVLHHKKNLGVGASRNNGIQAATGKYIVFLDSDDNLMKGSLQGLENTIKKKMMTDVVIVRHKKKTFPNTNYKLIKDNEKTGNNPEKLINYVYKKKIPFADCWFFAIRKNFITKNKIDFPNIRFGESELFVAKAISLMKNYKCFSGNFYFKKDRDVSLTQSRDLDATLSVLKSLIGFCSFKKKAKLTKIKKNFLNIYIQNTFGIFTALLILRKNYEIKKLSALLEKNKKNIKNLTKNPENIDLKSLIIKHGSYRGLLKYRELILTKNAKLFKNFNPKFTDLYAYCRSQYTAATINILKSLNYKIKGIIDDNESFKGSNFLNYNTINSSKFFKKLKKNLINTGVIITHQRTITSEKISKQLIKMGLGKNQILKIKY